MSRGLIAGVVALCGAGALGAWYSQLTVTAPSPRVATLRSAAPRAREPDGEPRVVRAPTARPSARSPEMERLEARRVLYENVDAFLQAGELDQARQLLDEDERSHGDDPAPPWRDLEQSYRLIADCLERPTPQLRARARAFALVSEAGALKSRLLAACQG